MAIKWYLLFESWEDASQALPKNTLRKATVEGKAVCLINQNGNFRATSNLCPHMQASLADGRLNAFNEIICPLHGYRFNLISGRESNERCDDLEIHSLEEKDDGIYLGIAQ